MPFIVPPGNRERAGDFHRPYGTQKPFSFTIHRGTLPQSRVRSTAPSKREPGWGCAIQRAARKPQGCGRFSSPLRNSKTVSLYHSTDDTPSASLRSAAPSEREPGMGAYHSTGYSLNRKGAGDFHRPYERRFPFIGGHSLSLAFARQLPQGGSREGVRTIQRPLPSCEGGIIGSKGGNNWL